MIEIETKNYGGNVGVFNISISNAIMVSENATNGDVIEQLFGKDIYCNLIKMMYSSCCEKMKKWWDTPYKVEVE